MNLSRMTPIVVLLAAVGCGEVLEAEMTAERQQGLDVYGTVNKLTGYSATSAFNADLDRYVVKVTVCVPPLDLANPGTTPLGYRVYFKPTSSTEYCLSYSGHSFAAATVNFQNQTSIPAGTCQFLTSRVGKLNPGDYQTVCLVPVRQLNYGDPADLVLSNRPQESARVGGP